MNLKKILLLLVGIVYLNFAQAQIQIDWLNVIENQTSNGIELYATNDGHCPVTISMGFKKLINMKADVKLPALKVIPNDGEEHLVVTLSVENIRKNSEYIFDFTYALGNTINTVHDQDHAYVLPFQKGKKSVIGQGYHGKFSHHNIYALDFDLREGTEVLAARDGVVIAVKEDSNYGCKSTKCKGHANYVLIYHQDGTFGSYVHLKKNGAKVKEGDKVNAGDVIGYSGNTGWSSGPHLHFEVYIPEMTRRKSVKTKFLIEKGKVDYLTERETYTSK